MNAGGYAVIILAAGFSSRMVRFKPVIKLDGTTVAERLISLYRGLGIAVYLIAGYQKGLLLSGISSAGVTVVENPDYARGMFSSVKTGLQAIKDQNYRAFFVQPVDVPLVRSYSIQSLIAARERAPKAILYPCFGQKRGHPPLIDAGLMPGILTWPEDGGLKAFLAAHESLAGNVSLADSNILFDIDTPEDIPSLEDRYRLLGIPGRQECEVILKDIHPVTAEIQSHSRAVADLAWELGHAVMVAGEQIDLNLIWAAARLHDIAKGQPHHEQAGARILEEMGFPKVARIVAGHTELEAGQTVSLETKIVFLADKYIKDNRRVNLEERYENAREKFGASAAALSNIDRRQQQAVAAKIELEKLLGYPLEQIIFA